MQQKAINLCNWLNELVSAHIPECEEKVQLQKTLNEYFVSETNYNNFMFSMVPSVCTVPKTKGSVESIRKLKSKPDREVAIKNATAKLKVIKAVIDAVLSLPEDELDSIVLKLSLYVNLFTDMYFQ